MDNNRRWWAAVATVVGLLLGGLGSTPTISAQAPASDPTLAYQIIARLNQWRIDEGFSPFKPNDTLTALAYAQAAYLWEQDLGAVTDWHAGRQDENPRERAAAAPYNWPSYNSPLQIAIGENAAYGTVDSAISFWQSSETHHDTVLNPEYREIGAAAVEKDGETIFIVVFGARPNVLPILINPYTDNLHLTLDQYRYAAGDRLQAPNRVRFFDADGVPLGDWMDWQSTLPLPEGSAGHISAFLTDGSHQAITTIDLVEDRVILPGFLPDFEFTGAAAPVVCPTAEPLECPQQIVSAPTSTGEDGSLPFTTNTPASISTPLPTATPTQVPTITLEPSASPTPEVPEIQIVYDDRSWAMVNVAAHTVNIQELGFVGNGHTIGVDRWTTYVDVPLSAFTSGGCLQAWSWNESAALPLPDACRNRWSVLTLSPDTLFWTRGFEVYRNGSLLATCEAGAGQCVVDLP